MIKNDEDTVGLGESLEIPPQWVPIGSAPDWIERMFGISADVVRIPLILAVRDKARLAPSQSISVKPRLVGRGGLMLPRGLERSRENSNRVIVSDWTLAEASSDCSSVRGFNHERLAVELHWPEISVWVGFFKAELNAKEHVARRKGLARLSVGKSLPKNLGGRPPKWDWVAFRREIVRIADSLDGLPPRNDLTKHMTDWCMDKWGDTPPDSEIRREIKDLMTD
jgi:hypothetical protein